MDTLFFFQIVGAVFMGCALFALSAYGYSKIHRREKEGGSIRDVSGWTLVYCILGPLITAAVLYSLK